MLDRQEPWARLQENRRKAASYALDVLVWGPAPGESLEYRKRVEIRDALTAAGHHAAFSEQLVPADSPDVDPLDDELLQADAAHLIVVLYGSRGTQSEVDRLLVNSRFAEKALVFVAGEILALAMQSVSQGTWKKLSRIGHVVEYSSEELEACAVVGKACEFAETARRAAFVAELRTAAA